MFTDYHPYFFIMFITINVIGFIMMGIDKRRAVGGKWRISERTLMLTALVGAAIGMLFGMKVFRHKTKKPLFTIGLPLFLLLHVLIIGFSFV